MHIPAGGWPLWLQQSRGGTRRVKGVVARQVKKQAPSGLHESTGGRKKPGAAEEERPTTLKAFRKEKP